MIYRFGAFEIDRETYVVKRQGEVLSMRPRLVDVLVYLIENRSRVVTHTELLAAFWESDTAPPNALHWAVSKIRMALEQEGRHGGPIETVPRRGYRFVAELESDAESGRTASGGAQAGLDASSLARASMAPAAGASELARPELFVGRESVMQTLRSAWGRAQQGQGSMQLLLGEPGIGKSRAALEFARKLPAPGMVWYGNCGQGESAPPLWPWLQVLRACAEAAQAGSWQQHECEAVLTVLERSALQRESTVNSARSVLLLDRIRALLLHATQERPRIVLIDDLADADEASLDLLILLSTQLFNAKLMILATLRRPGLPVDRNLDGRLRLLCSRAECTQLAPWSREEVAAFVAACATGPSDDERATHLWHDSGGNPLYLHELVRLEGVHGVGTRGPSELESVVGRRVIPDAVQDLVRSRVRAFADATVSVLRVASVIGRHFELALLERIAPGSGGELLAALDPALEAGVIEALPGPGAFRFRHDLIRDAIYVELPGALRAQLHAEIGRVLEDETLAPHSPSVLAWHFYCASPISDAEKAVAYASRAARSSRRMGALGDAIRYWEWALEAQAFCRDLPAERRCELLLELGSTMIEFSRVREGRRHVTRAIEIAEAQQLPRILARGALSLRQSMLLSATPDGLAQRALEEARRVLPPEELSLRSRVASHLACVRPYLRRRTECEELLAEAFRLAHEAGEARSAIDAHRAACQLETSPDRARELFQASCELEGNAEKVGDRRATFEAHLYRYLALLQLGKLREADEIIGALSRVSVERSSREHSGLLWHLVARSAFFRGDVSSMLDQLGRLQQGRRGRGRGLGEFHWLAGMTLAHLERGTAEEIWPVFQERTLLWRRNSPALYGMWLRMLIAVGRQDETRAELDGLAEDLIRRTPLPPGQLGALAHVAVAAAALRDVERCRLLYEELAAHAELHAVDLLWFSLGSVEYYLGVLAEVFGDLKTARAHFEAALASNCAAAHVPQIAWSQFRLGHLLVADAERSVQSRGTRLLEEAAATARANELNALVLELDRLTPGAQPSVPSS